MQEHVLTAMCCNTGQILTKDFLVNRTSCFTHLSTYPSREACRPDSSGGCIHEWVCTIRLSPGWHIKNNGPALEPAELFPESRPCTVQVHDLPCVPTSTFETGNEIVLHFSVFALKIAR